MVKLENLDNGRLFQIFHISKKHFDKVYYIPYKNALRECKLVKLITKLTMEKGVYNTPKLYKNQILYLNISGCGIVGFEEKFWLDIDVYNSPSDYVNRKSVNIFFNLIYTLKLEEIINHIVGKDVVSYSNYHNSIITYKWNGTKVERIIPTIPSTIIQDKYGIKFDEELTFDFTYCYAKYKDCKDNSLLEIVTFEDEENPFEWEFDKLIEQTQELRNSLYQLKLKIGENKLNGKVNLNDELEDNINKLYSHLDKVEITFYEM